MRAGGGWNGGGIAQPDTGAVGIQLHQHPPAGGTPLVQQMVLETGGPVAESCVISGSMTAPWGIG
jgi:hypothetical protein